MRLAPPATPLERATVFVVVPDPAPTTRPPIHHPGPRLARAEEAKRLAKQLRNYQK